MTDVFFLAIMEKIFMKDLHFMRLMDKYSPLLTDTQREMTELYFNCDLSLSEIAEQKGCSRQGVSDCLNIVRKKFEEYEEKLHLVAMTEALEAFAQTHPEYKAEVERILEGEK